MTAQRWPMKREEFNALASRFIGYAIKRMEDAGADPRSLIELLAEAVDPYELAVAAIAVGQEIAETVSGRDAWFEEQSEREARRVEHGARLSAARHGPTFDKTKRDALVVRLYRDEREKGVTDAAARRAVAKHPALADVGGPIDPTTVWRIIKASPLGDFLELRPRGRRGGRRS